jgi:hypothetical protein
MTANRAMLGMSLFTNYEGALVRERAVPLAA